MQVLPGRGRADAAHREKAQAKHLACSEQTDGTAVDALEQTHDLLPIPVARPDEHDQ